MEKALIINPIENKSEDRLKREKENAERYVSKEGYDPEYRIVTPEKAIINLSDNLRVLSHCDALYLCYGWEESEECKYIEKIARYGNIKILSSHYLDIGDVVKTKGVLKLVTDTDTIETRVDSISLDKIQNYYIEFATSNEIDEWNDKKLHPKNIHYSKKTHKLVYWFLKGDKVLVRNKDNSWKISTFMFYSDETNNRPFYTTDNWECCLPCNSETIRLLGTTKEYNG